MCWPTTWLRLTTGRLPRSCTAARCEVVTLNVNGRRHEVTKQRTVIGRSRECDLQIEDPSASRRHAELRQEGTAYWIVDLDSTNGIEVNGRRITRAKLDPGDIVTVGSTDITFGTERERA